ncbi:MAG TPA: hypothetical protein VGP72_16925 [Planctomycetota bacterium]|jgi:hypothetical protein
MERKSAGMQNVLIAVLALTALLVWQRPDPVQAVGGGSWDTDGMMVNTTENEAERLVLVDTTAKTIMVYRTEGVGQFRLVAARSYQFDVLLKDTSKNDEIERRNGITFMQAFELYAKRNAP